MKEEKNLDRLFQEKFKDFEKAPSDAVWKNIVQAQSEKEDRKIIPLWWKLGGVAAVIALLFTTAVILFNNSPSKSLENEVVTTSKPDKGTSTPGNNIPEGGDNTQEVITPATAEQIKITASQTAPSNQDQNESLPTLKSDAPRAVASAQRSYAQNTSQKEGKETASSTATRQQQDIAAGVAVSTNDKTASTPLPKEERPLEILENQINPTSGVTQTAPEIKDIVLPSETSEGKVSLVDEAKRIEDSKKESEEAIAQLGETENTNRWNLGAVAAPVYYGDFGGSGIDPSFSDNSKSGEINFSYGVQVSYNVSPKIKVRTGVSNVDLSYNTDGIAFAASTTSRRITGANFNENARDLKIGDARSVRRAIALQNDLFPENANTTRAINGTLQQRVGFVEIPVEAIYVVSDKRIGLQVVGGLSTLFLNNNEVFLNTADGFQNNLGSANGINDVSFTTNIGLGLDYKMTDKIKFNVEPSLKYQLNAFDESVGDFRPYFIGLYTGVSYRF